MNKAHLTIALIAMMSVVASSNYLVQFPINDWLTWGALPYPISFLITEITNQRYGPKNARNLVYSGFVLGVFLSLYFATPKIALASGSAFLIAQLLDIMVFSGLRQSIWWYAPFFASSFASFFDTSIFWTIAFWGESGTVLTWAIGDFLVKVTIDVVLLIPFRIFCVRLRQYAN